MEITRTRYKLGKLVRICVAMLLLLCIMAGKGMAQTPVKSYTVKDGRMFIALGKKLKESTVDSFIIQYGLQDLGLKHFIKGMMLDSLAKLGWKVNVNNKELFVISKPLFGFDDLTNPAEKIILAEKQPSYAEIFPAVSNLISYGVNEIV